MISDRGKSPNQEHNARSFQPIVNSNSKVLVLGSMPGVASLKANQYYAYPRNQFWNIVFDLFLKDVPEIGHTEISYEEKIEFLKTYRIALWDVIGSCERSGSLDSDIRNEIPNEFETFYQAHPLIKDVFFNGKKAYTVYKRRVGFVDGINYHIMPSTSPAHTMAYTRKLEVWQQLKVAASIGL